MPPEAIGTLRCPKCGNDVVAGGDIRYVETTENSHRIHGVDERRLTIDGSWEIGDSKAQWFECHGQDAGSTCGHRWPVPDWIKPLIEWV